MSTRSWRGATDRILNGSQHSQQDYELLPLSTPIPHRRRYWRLSLHFFTIRRTLASFALIPFFLLILILWSGVPPSFQDIRAFERALPQHNANVTQPAMYLRFPGHLWGHGFNNVLQESLLMSYLAYASNRSFVFEDYVWSHSPLPYTLYDFALRPTKIPINAFISGPTAGGPMDARRSVSAEYWEIACPKEDRRIISSRDSPSSTEGSELIKWWVKKLKEVEGDACVEVDSSERVVFDMHLFGGQRIISLWDGLSSSPILANYAWSPLVQSAVIRNFAILPQQPHSGLVALHIRRGDYERHCPRLSGWNSGYMGMNLFPALPDRFEPPSEKGTSDGERQAYYMQHCLPSVEQIVERLHAVRAEQPGLKRVYVLTNAWGWWLNGLNAALKLDGWEDLKSSLDVRLDEEQRYVSMAVDMAIAEKAEVFVGNGFSSLTANIVMLRMAEGFDISSNRFL